MIAQMVQRRLKQRQKTLLATIRGAFGSAGAAGGAAPLKAVRVDAFDESGEDATGEQLMSIDLFIDTKSLMGELADDLMNGALWIHPSILAALEKADETSFDKASRGPWTIRTYRGIPIYVSESLVRAGSSNGYVYETYLLARGIVAWGEKPQKTDVVDVAALQMEKNLRAQQRDHLRPDPVRDAPQRHEVGGHAGGGRVRPTPNWERSPTGTWSWPPRTGSGLSACGPTGKARQTRQPRESDEYRSQTQSGPVPRAGAVDGRAVQAGATAPVRAGPGDPAAPAGPT
ncbi:MAG: hypothetical protein M5U12_12025 [Verrucomicrobia bacterium]|nr:hypothetical protein [Verrucomicrobiota bacterium]